MSYESRIYIYDRNDFSISRKNGWISGNLLAVLNMSSMGYGKYLGKSFREIFITPVDFDHCDIYGNEKLDEIKKDAYGDVICYTDIDTVIEWLNNYQGKESYRRVYPLLAILNSYKQCQCMGMFNQIVVVHEGY